MLEQRAGGAIAASFADAGNGTNRHPAPILPSVNGPDPGGGRTARLQSGDGEGRLAYYPAILSYVKLVLAAARQLSAADKERLSYRNPILP
jgi:hypothetical protein